MRGHGVTPQGVGDTFRVWGSWPLDMMKQHPPPDTARTAHSQPPPVLLPSPHLNRNTWDALTPPGRVSGPSGSPRCAELAGRTLCLHSSDGRRRSSTLRTERERRDGAVSLAEGLAGRRGCWGQRPQDRAPLASG